MKHTPAPPSGHRWRRSAVLICSSQLTVELQSESVQQMGHCLVDADVPVQLGTQWRHALPLDTTRDDVVKPRQVGVAVQRQTVRRDVAAAVDPCRDTVWLAAIVGLRPHHDTVASNWENKTVLLGFSSTSDSFE